MVYIVYRLKVHSAGHPLKPGGNLRCKQAHTEPTQWDSREGRWGKKNIQKIYGTVSIFEHNPKSWVYSTLINYLPCQDLNLRQTENFEKTTSDSETIFFFGGGGLSWCSPTSCMVRTGLEYRKDTEPFIPCFHVLTYITSFRYLFIHAMTFIACYNYMLSSYSRQMRLTIMHD